MGLEWIRPRCGREQKRDSVFRHHPRLVKVVVTLYECGVNDVALLRVLYVYVSFVQCNLALE